MKKIFVGIDLHKDSLTYCVLDEKGEELEVGRIATKTRKKKAATALARKLLIWLWAMHTTKSNWNKETDNPVCSKSYRHTESLIDERMYVLVRHICPKTVLEEVRRIHELSKFHCSSFDHRIHNNLQFYLYRHKQSPDLFH